MRRYLFILFITIHGGTGAQIYSSQSIFAHNDYATTNPFYAAYDAKVGFIEADVFLQGSKILVAHHADEVDDEKTLRTLYLEPLVKMITKNNGLAYVEKDLTLTLMIDLKTEGEKTLKAVVTELEKYPSLILCPTLHVMISGSVPDPDAWSQYPPFISFDGRPAILYTQSQLERVRMISTRFQDHVTWDGHGPIPAGDLETIHALVQMAHSRNKLFRFWATPDFEQAWKELMQAGMDVIVTDHTSALADYLKRRR